MGGFGSGRPAGHGRQTVESCRSLDVNRLHNDGCLDDGWCGIWQWTHEGETSASLIISAEADRLHLSYRVYAGGGWQDVRQTLRIVRVPCHLGGDRPYFLCPMAEGVGCGRRVAKLYAVGRSFLCRHCHRLAYRSQQENELVRAVRRATKVRQRLGGAPDPAAGFPERPKGMWRRTYDRLLDRAIAAELRADAVFFAQAERLLARIDEAERKEPPKAA